MNNEAAFLRSLFDAAVAAADPALTLERHLPEKPRSGRCVVVGGGKASARMAAALERCWPDVRIEGAVAVPAGQDRAGCNRITVLDASHPKPDERSEQAGRRMLELVRGLEPDDLVLALVSGGGSALLAVPAPGITLEQKSALTSALLRSGAAIGEINLVRRQLSAIKNGALAVAAAPARVVTLLISDIPGDNPADIASGPTLPGRGNGADALRVLHHYRIAVPEAVRALLDRMTGAATDLPDSDIRMLATPFASLEAAASRARAGGITPIVLGDALEGESRELGRLLAGIARSVREHGAPLPAPCVLLSGGETTVSIGDGPAGRGGRNTEAALAFALSAPSGCWALMADTDGIDGDSDAAGAIVRPDTLRRAAGIGLDPHALLTGHDSNRFFDALGDLVRTGPTGTNVNDFRAVLVP
ncbi:glycerate kinase type-2 family protein [Endosaccharibacter trunci]|uniref:glycerate kinase type-2 family protein n=1 Tax=Endosaccharibacter trunci TaxID=2812733 RepID=UPI003BF50846